MMTGEQSRLILTAAPDYIDPAWRELQRAVKGSATKSELAPGVLLVSWPGSFWDLAEKWQRLEQRPIFVRHIAPVQLTLASPTLDALRHLVADNLADLFDDTLTFSVQTRTLKEEGPGSDTDLRPFDVNNALAELIHSASGADLDVRQPQQILSVLIAGSRDERAAYIGLSLAEHNLSDWAGGVRRFRREPEQISRAEFKLLEALEQFAVDLPPRGTALDLGASPGGWTRVLRRREQYVTAVDPARLHPSLMKDKRVRHIRQTSEEYFASSQNRGEPELFDLIVNDMRLDGRDSARLMVAYTRCLRPNGIAIMTLKLPETGWEPVLDHSLNILRRAYRILAARQLFHNRNEITLLLHPAT